LTFVLLGVLDNNETGLQESTDAISKHGKKAGLQINNKKMKVMNIDEYTSRNLSLKILVLISRFMMRS